MAWNSPPPPQPGLIVNKRLNDEGTDIYISNKVDYFNCLIHLRCLLSDS
jgi:hypothetical protein